MHIILEGLPKEYDPAISIVE